MVKLLFGVDYAKLVVVLFDPFIRISWFAKFIVLCHFFCKGIIIRASIFFGLLVTKWKKKPRKTHFFAKSKTPMVWKQMVYEKKSYSWFEVPGF